MEITQANFVDVNDILRLANVCFGDNYLTENHILNQLNSKKNVSYCLKRDNILIGFIFLEWYDASSITDYFFSEKEWFTDYYKNNGSIFIIKQVAIQHEYRNLGLSEKLFQKSMLKIEEDCASIISTCWVKPDPNPMEILLKNNGFVIIKEINNYWSNDSLIKGYTCEICGSPPCKCSAKIFELKKLIKN